MKKILSICLIGLLIASNAYAGTVSRFSTYATGGEVNATNLNGNFDNLVNTINAGLDNDNADTAGGFRFIEVLGSLPAAGTEGRTIFLTTDDTLNFDDGSSFNQAITVSGTPSADDIPIYTTTWARVQYIPAENMSGFEIGDTANDDLTITVQAGKLIHGNISIQKTSNTTLTFATAGDWWDGATDTYAGGAGHNYVGVDSSGNVKLLGNNKADAHDADGNTSGTNFYWDDTSKRWRVIGAVYIDTDNKIHASYVTRQHGKKVYYDDPAGDTSILRVLTNGSQTSFTDVDCSAAVPDGIARACSLNISSGSGALVSIRTNGSSAGTGLVGGSDGTTGIGHFSAVVLDSNGIFEYKVSANTASLYVASYELSIR